MISDFFEKYDIQKFENDIPTDNFDCGDEDLNDFIRREVWFYKEQLIAMPYIVVENGKTGCRFVTVDAYNAAVPFYEKNGFDFLTQKDENPTQLMFFDLINLKL